MDTQRYMQTSFIILPWDYLISQRGEANINTNRRYILFPIAFNKCFSAYVQHYGLSAQSNGIQAKKDRIDIASSLNDNEAFSYLAFGL